MLEVSPLIVTEWDVTILAFTGVELPYALDVPYSTCESAGSFVVHVIVALLLVTPDDMTLEITGGVVSDVPLPRSPAS